MLLFMHTQVTGHSLLTSRYKHAKRREHRSTLDFVNALKQCGKTGDLERGKRIHLDATAANCHANKYVAAALISMYIKCGSMQRAREVFESTTHRDVVTWTSLILGYVENGESSMALEMFTQMDCEPNYVTYIALLKACARLAKEGHLERHVYLKKGIAFHREIKDRGYDSNLAVMNTLLDMYGKCGSMQHARKVFQKMYQKDVITWNCLILGYVENGESSVALDLFNSMDCTPTAVTYGSALKACGCLAMERAAEKQACLERGTAIHRQIQARGFDSDVVLSSSLVDMYRKCGSMQSAREVFDGMASKNAVIWSCLISGYVENGESSGALELFFTMDCEPDHVLYIAALKSCAMLATKKASDKESCLIKGTAIHKQVKEREFHSDIVVATMLIDMYGKCGSMHCAYEVFKGMIQKDAVTWNCLISGYVENGQSNVALDLFAKMDCEPTGVTYVAALRACVGLNMDTGLKKQLCLEKGIAIHKQVKASGLHSDIDVISTLVDMYAKCGCMQGAYEIFSGLVHKDVVTWNCLLHGYVENGESSVALEFYDSIDCEPNHVSYLAVLKACTALAMERGSDKEGYLKKGIDIHKRVKERGFDCNVLVANRLIDMYAKCGSMRDVRDMFDDMIHKNVVTWNSVITGYVENGESSMALDLFISMDCEPDNVVYAAAINACGNLAALPTGKWIHYRVCRHEFEEDPVLGNALLDFYGKCGSMSAAEEMFSIMRSPDIVSWTALITGYASIGRSDCMFRLVKQIEEAGLHMDCVSFICILTACSHAGLVEEGKAYFRLMSRYGVSPSVEHYNCVIDMLGRANRLEEAFSFINSMPLEANAVTWTTLLGACKKWKNLKVSKAAFDALVSCNKENTAAAYVMMRDIYKTSEVQG